MSRWPSEAPVIALPQPLARSRRAGGDLIPRWGRGWLRAFARPHLLFVEEQQVWHWEARRAAAGPAKSDKVVTVTPRRFDSVSAWCGEHAGTDARLVLSGRLTHHVVIQDQALPLHDELEIGGYARHQLVHYHGGAAQHWPLAVWNDGLQRGTCALHGLDLSALMHEAARCGVRLRCIEPAWAAALRFALRRDPSLADPARAAVALVEGTHVGWLVCERGVLISIRQRVLDAPTQAALAALLDDLRHEDGELPSVHVLGFGIAADALPGTHLLGTLRATHPALEWLVP